MLRCYNVYDYQKKIRLFSFDFRGHGYNTSSGDNLSVNSLINDTVTVLKYISETLPIGEYNNIKTFNGRSNSN